jgi:serine/threonine-protein kinase RsbT
MLELRSGDDIVRARMAARDLVRQAGLGLMDQTRFATAVSELGRNAVRYGTQGQCVLSDCSDARHWRLQARISDRGPGIASLQLAMQDGYSTGGGLGAGPRRS